MDKAIDTPEKKKPLRRQLPSYIMLCFFAAFNVCFFMPMDIYIANASDIEIPIKPLAACLGIVTAAVFAALLLGCIFIKGKANRIFRAAIFGLSVAFYIQGNFLAVKMGMLNGEQYSQPAWKIALNIVIWLVMLAVPFIILWKLPDEFDGLVSYISAAVFIVLLIALGISAYKNIPNYDAVKLDYIFNGESISYCSKKDLDLYSENKNLIVIIADEYDSFLFDGAAKEAPETISEFDGFTYYTNALGKYGFTTPSVAYITSGGAFGDAYNDLTFYENAAANFKANFYSDTIEPPSSVMEKYCDNVGTMELKTGEAIGIVRDVCRLAFFRCMPEILKPLFWIDGQNIGETISDSLEKRVIAELGAGLYDIENLAFYNSLPRELVKTDEDVFKYIFFQGVHSIRIVTKDLEYIPDRRFELSPEEEAIAVNKIINEYFRILKENGVYDNSEIIFMADHGLTGHYGKKFPLLMYKPANQQTTGITVSNAPISYDDMFPTLVKLTGGEPNARTIFDIAEDEERVRYFGEENEEFSGNIKSIYN